MLPKSVTFKIAYKLNLNYAIGFKNSFKSVMFIGFSINLKANPNG